MHPYLNQHLRLEPTIPWSEAQYAILGVPFDSTCTYRSGTRMAPLQIRSEFLELEKDVGGRNFFDVPVYDLGNVEVCHGSVRKTFSRIQEVMDAVSEQNNTFTPIVLGGEHTVSYPIIEAYHQDRELEVVWVDAHLDLKSEQNEIEWGHSTILYQITRLGIPVTILGARTASTEERERAKDSGIKVIEGLVELKDLRKQFKDKNIYLSVDMDVLDPSVAPGVSNPEPIGWDMRTLMSVVGALTESSKVNGFDIMEVCPPYDSGNISSVAAAKVLLDFVMTHSLN